MKTECPSCGYEFEASASWIDTNPVKMTNVEFVASLMESGETPLAQAIVIQAISDYVNRHQKASNVETAVIGFINPERWAKDCRKMAEKVKAKYNPK